MSGSSKASQLWGSLLCLVLLAGCGGPQDSLFTNAKDSDCPPGCASSLKADSNQMYLRTSSTNITLRSVTAGNIHIIRRLDLSGDCYASLYGSNMIDVTVRNSTGTITYGVSTYPSLQTTNETAQCKNGRFFISLDLTTGGLPDPGSFQVALRLIGYDENGAAHQNESDGLLIFNVQRVNQ